MLSKNLLSRSTFATKQNLMPCARQANLFGLLNRHFASKVFPSAAEVSGQDNLTILFISYIGNQRHQIWANPPRWWFRPLRHSFELDRGGETAWSPGPHSRVQQRRSGRLGPRPLAEKSADQENDLVLCRREQGV